MKNIRRLLKIESRLLLILAFLFINYQAMTPATCDFGVTIQDKVLHFLAFYLLSLLVDFAFPKTSFGAVKIMGLLGYGIAIEIAQSFMPYRCCSLYDLLADVCGIGLYLISIPIWKHVPVLRARWHDE